jgi:hypothetical protein
VRAIDDSRGARVVGKGTQRIIWMHISERSTGRLTGSVDHGIYLQASTRITRA